MISISPQVILAAVVMGVTIATAIWHAAMHVGRLTVRMERVEGTVIVHGTRLDAYDRRVGESDRRNAQTRNRDH